MNIALGSDHAGFTHKEMLRTWLESQGHTVQDFGTHSADSMDYPDVAHPVATAVETGAADLGVLLCGSANGVCITANKHAGIRAGLAWEPEVADLVRRHNDANVLCIPARFVSEEQARAIAATFLRTAFEGGRHQLRVGKISA